jgi:hypothetical protein
MSEPDFVSAILAIRDQIGFLWNFYVTACVFLLGWIFSSKVEWTQEKRKAILVLFAIFALTNLMAIFKEYRLLEAATEDLRLLAGANGKFLYQISSDAGFGAMGAVFIHLIADSLIYYLVNLRISRTHS